MHDFEDGIGDLQDELSHHLETKNRTRILDLVRRLFDRSGIPLRLKRSDWDLLLTTLRELEGSAQNGALGAIGKKIDRFERVIHAFERPDGSAIWSDPNEPDARRSKRRAKRATGSEPRIESEVLALRESMITEAVPLAVFHSESDQAWLAIDDRNPVDSFQVEFGVKRNVFLGPSGRDKTVNDVDSNLRTRVPTIRRVRGTNAHAFEWSWRSKGRIVTRTAALLGDEGVAILAEEVDDQGEGAVMRVEIPEGIEASPIPESSSIRLSARRGASVVVVPLALSPFPGAGDQGSFCIEEFNGKRYLALSQSSVPGANRLWLPLAIVWRTLPSRTILRRKKLTVSEKSTVCRPGVAFAARLPWDVGDSMLIYRSLTKKALRAVLGHYVKSSFLIAKFNADGNLAPIVAID